MEHILDCLFIINILLYVLVVKKNDENFKDDVSDCFWAIGPTH